MKKELLLRYIKGIATVSQEKEVLEWINISEENEKYFLSLNNLWISQNLSQEEASKEEIDEIRKLTTQKRTQFRGYNKYLAYAAVAVILISVGLNVFFVGNDYLSKGKLSELPIRLAELPSVYRHEVYTEKGVKARLSLPDGSQVWLNSDSKITYPDKFESDIREIEFSGEAYFDVVKDSLRPLIIKTNKDFKVEVYGTKFNLKSYDNDDEAQTTLYSGSLNVVTKKYGKGSKASGESITTLKPSESFIIKNDKTAIHIKNRDIDKHSAWKNGDIIFEATPLIEVVKMLERWHGTKFVIKDPSIYKFDITAQFHTESIVQIMEMLKYCALIDYSVDSNKVVLFRR